MLKYLQMGLLLAVCTVATGDEPAPPTTRPATAPTTAPATAHTTHLTIYSAATPGSGEPRGMAIVQQRRTLDLSAPEADIHLRDLPATADFTTVTLRPLIPASFKVLSQTYVEQVNDPDALLRRAIGHEIIINRKVPGQVLPGERTRPPETINAKLLGFDQHQLVLATNNRQLPIQIIPRGPEISEIKLMASSSAAMTKPPISCRIATDKPGPHEAELTYQTTGIDWQAEYDLLLDSDKPVAQFTASINIINRTGIAFEDAIVSYARGTVTENGAPTRVYAVPFVSLPASASHRVTIADAAALKYEVVLACGPEDYAKSPSMASTYVAIQNASGNKLGRPLPPGRVRISRQVAHPTPLVLLAESTFEGAEQDSLMLFRIGQPSQVTVRRQELDRRQDGPSFFVTTQITLRNPHQKQHRILLIEPTPAPACEIIDKSDGYEKQSAGIIFSVDVPSGGEKTVRYTTRRPAQ